MGEQVNHSQRDIYIYSVVTIKISFNQGLIFINAIWFNEGGALLVDFRTPYLLENIALSTKESEFVRNNEFNFFIGNRENIDIFKQSIAVSELTLI
ncbi:hypothetical protein [uncultured Shewanella sp.]|uniref:hypothetical protein n=1 Tax=uncultured Shewanella sp. TaxID=173975 RepID=UPI00260D8737|nr:hypothetical protein [uncultured Shewanella sp.]